MTYPHKEVEVKIVEARRMLAEAIRIMREVRFILAEQDVLELTQKAEENPND